jgi:hypothetical protein
MLGTVQVSAEMVAMVPAANIVVSRAQFGAVWAASEQQAAASNSDGFLVGLALTCRWLAAQPVWSLTVQREELPRSPASGQNLAASPETIEPEYRDATALAQSADATPEARDLARGVAAMLSWACHGAGAPPIAPAA